MPEPGSTTTLGEVCSKDLFQFVDTPRGDGKEIPGEFAFRKISGSLHRFEKSADATDFLKSGAPVPCNQISDTLRVKVISRHSA